MYVTAVKRAQDNGIAGAAERRTKSIAYAMLTTVLADPKTLAEHTSLVSCRDTKTHAEHFGTS